jgi:prevent-host-death family protein
MRIAPLADVKAKFSAYLKECGEEGPLVITRNGKAVAVILVPYDEDDLERLMLARSPCFRALLARSRQSIKGGKGLSEQAFWGAIRKCSRQRKGAGAAVRRSKR